MGRLLLAVSSGAGVPPVGHLLCWILDFDGFEELPSVLQRVEGEGGVEARVDVVVTARLLGVGAASYLAVVGWLTLQEGAVSLLGLGRRISSLCSRENVSFQDVRIGDKAIDKLLAVHLLDDVLRNKRVEENK